MDNSLDTIACPKCGSNSWHINGYEEVEFKDNGTAEYSADCHCKECNKYFRIYMDFKYTITKTRTEE